MDLNDQCDEDDQFVSFDEDEDEKDILFLRAKQDADQIASLKKKLFFIERRETQKKKQWKKKLRKK